MLNLFTQYMFEATRVAPLKNAATAKDWRMPPAQCSGPDTGRTTRTLPSNGPGSRQDQAEPSRRNS
jgi:hypothetical protein